jgi:RNA polymerase sigma-70 factor, ECF subfamily
MRNTASFFDFFVLIVMEISKVEKLLGGYLLNFIKSMVSCTEDAKDIYQEVIVKIISKQGSLTKEQSLKSWLFTVARNQIIDYYRARKIPKELDTSTLENTFERSEKKAYGKLESCLPRFIDLLPEEYKDLIIKAEIQGKSQKQLSETTGINYVTLRSKVQRGRDRIRKMVFDACHIEKDAAGGLLECVPKSNRSSCGSSSSCANNGMA